LVKYACLNINKNRKNPMAAAMMAEVRGGIWYSDILVDLSPPNTTVFNVLWPTSIALWGPVLPYTNGAVKKHLHVPDPPIYVNMLSYRFLVC
jgi:hypothetical protein